MIQPEKIIVRTQTKALRETSIKFYVADFSYDSDFIQK